MAQKKCDEGDHLVDSLFWRRTPDRKSACMQCAKKYFKPISKTVKMIDSRFNLTPKKVKNSIAPISNNRKEALKRYRRLRDKYFKDHPVCEYPDCDSTDITLHHGKGRCGAFLTDKRYFKSLCLKHHQFVEENPLTAQKLGLSFKRLDKHV